MRYNSDGLRQTPTNEELQEQKVRLETLARIYEQADRVITGDPIKVELADSGPAPAWSDGKSVTFNMEEIEDFDIEELSQLNGLNYHELCHLEYTPRKSSKLVAYVLDNNLMQSFNLLEDQRIETLFVGRFPAVTPYLQATIARWLMASPQDLQYNYVAIRGRRYLPMNVREMFRDNFVDQSLLKDIARIVDEYRLLSFPDDYNRACVLIREFQDLVLDKMPRPPQGGCGGRAPIESGRTRKGKLQRRDANKAERIQGKGDDISDKEGDDGEGQDQTQESEAAVKERNERAANDPKKGTFSLKPGQGHVESSGGVPEDFGKVLKRTIEDALSRKDVQSDVRSKQRVLFGGDGKHTDGLRIGKYDSTDVPSDVVMVQRRFQRELEALRSDSEPYWEKETPSGRLNVPRVVRGCEIDNAFDRWDEGNDSTDMEVVILVDRSGSMSWSENDRLASQACWVIKRACEAIDAPVTVYSFDDRAEIAYRRTEKAERSKFKFIYGNGGTNPEDALMEAERLLMSSRAKSKLMFLITDGQFHGTNNDEAIMRMSKRGVVTSMVMIMQEDQFNRTSWGWDPKDPKIWHGAEIKARVDSAATLVPLAKEVVIGAIKKRAMFG